MPRSVVELLACLKTLRLISVDNVVVEFGFGCLSYIHPVQTNCTSCAF